MAELDKDASWADISLPVELVLAKSQCRPAKEQINGRRTKFFVCLGRDGALRRPDAAARRPYLRRILSCTTNQLPH